MTDKVNDSGMYRVWWTDSRPYGDILMHSEPMPYDEAKALADQMNIDNPNVSHYILPER